MTDPDVLVDSSAAIALVLSSHEAHDATMVALDGQLLGLAGHAWFETFSVLTRLPPPDRRRPQEVATIMRQNFPESRFLSELSFRSLAGRIEDIGVAGGSVYDALVGQAAVEHGFPLASRDRRAIEIYRALGTTVQILF